MAKRKNTDFLVIGSGIAGLSFALKAAKHGKVTIITKKSDIDSSTNFAQGGIAAVVDESGDSISSHIKDTLEAGAYLNDRKVVELVCSKGPKRVRELIDWGVEFSRNEKGLYDLGMEGGHTHRRILHAKDMTGAAIEKALVKSCRENGNIAIVENTIAIDLLCLRKLSASRYWKHGGKAKFRRDEEDCCVGVYAFDKRTGEITTYRSEIVVIATGGCGQVYLHTTNPSIATGDGLGIAYRAGAAVRDLEFVQFHPTSLYSLKPQESSFLISEAVRGEGGVLLTKRDFEKFAASGLKDPHRFSFLRKYDSRGSLATRDVVARAIDAELKKTGDEFVYLVLFHKPAEFVKSRFPKIYERCLEEGIDITTQPIPVVPAAHYMVGGIFVDIHGQVIDRRTKGRGIFGLFAVGEASCTGLHGANRLASNSLLEAIVFSHDAYEQSIKQLGELKAGKYGDFKEYLKELPLWDSSNYKPIDENILLKHDIEEVKRLMWNYVGIVRSDVRLDRAIRRIKLLEEDITHYYWNYMLNDSLIELRNMILVARLIVEASLKRKENIGLFYNLDLDKKRNS